MEQEQAAGLNRCACGCGELVAGQWKRGHSSRGVGGYVAPLGDGEEDLPPVPFGAEVIDVGDLPGPRDQGGAQESTPQEPPPGEDEPPGHARREWQRRTERPPRARSGGKPFRVTQAIRGDIDAKISFALEIPGRVWQARDPVCGSVFVDQRPEIASALTEIVCQSSDLVAWFSGGGGQFMLWLNVMAAVWPVVTVAMAHHVYHSIAEEQVTQQQPDYGRFAA